MNVEERVRRALREDAAELDVPPRPAVADLDRRQRRRRWAWGAAAVATASVVVAMVVAAGVVPRGIVTIGPGDSQPPPDVGGDTLRFDDGDVFAAGTTRGVRWLAAAAGGEHPCVGVQVDRGGRLLGSSRCGPLDASPIVATHHGDTDAGVVAVAGWVSEEVARVVWELPDGSLELRLERHDGLPARVFAAAAAPGEDVSVLRAYDHTGRRLGGTGVTGAREPEEHPYDAAD